MKFSLEKKIFLGFIINIIVVLVFGWISNLRFQNQKEIISLEIHQQKVIISTEKISTILNTIDNNAKGFVLTGNEEYLRGYDITSYSIGRELEYLSHLFGNDPAQKVKLNEIEKLINEKTQYNEQLVEIRKYKDFETARNTITVEKDAQISNKINQVIAQVKENENRQFTKQSTKKNRNETVLKPAFIILLILSNLLLVIVYFIIRYNLKAKKEAELLLEKNKLVLQSIIDNTSNPVFIKLLNGQYSFVNKEFENLFHHTNEQLKGKTDYDIFPKDIADALRTADLDVLKTGKEIKVEEVVPQDDGLHTYIVVKFPLLDIEGKTYATCGIATDITERKKTDLSIIESEEQIQTIFNAAPDAVIVINEEGNIIKWNTKAESIFGWTAEEVLGKPIHSFIIPPQYLEKHLKGLKHFLQTGEGPIMNKHVEMTALSKNKVEFDIEINISSSRIKNKYIFIAFLKDLTIRNRLEKEVRQSKAFLDSIVENIPNMIFVKDAKELRFVRLNKAGEQLLGYSQQDMIGKNDFDFFPKDQANFFTNIDREVLDKGEFLDILEEPIDTKNGKRWLHTQKIPITDGQGNMLYLLGISEDITEQKHLTDERDRAERSLRENEQRIKLILENIGEGVIVADTHQKIVLSNHMAEEILGIQEAGTLSIDWSHQNEIFYPDESTVFPAQNLPLEKALRGEISDNVEIIIQNPKSMEKKRVIVMGRPIKDRNNQIIAAVTTLRDITKYKEMQDALEESEIKYRNVIGFKRGIK